MIRRVVLATFAVVLSFATPTRANDDAAAPACIQELNAVASAPAVQVAAATRRAATCLLQQKDLVSIGQQFALATVHDPAAARQALTSVLNNASASPEARRAAARLLLDDTVQAEQLVADGVERLKAKDLDGAKAACDAALKIKTGDARAQECQSAADRAILLRATDRKLDLAEAHIAAKRYDEATKLLMPDVWTTASDPKRVLDLAKRVSEASQADAKAAVDADLDLAERYIDAGRRDDAMSLIKQDLAKATADQKARAARLVQTADGISLSLIGDRLHAGWLWDLAFAFLIAGLLFLIALGGRRARVAYVRWRTRGTPVTWTLGDVLEDGGSKLSASDVILDALRRVPHEVRHDLWEPASILYQPVASDQFNTPIWEQFLLAPDQPACRIGEGLRGMQLDQEKRPRDDFFAAFQNAQLPTASAPVVPVMRIFKAAYDWWRAGEPSFSGVAAVRAVGVNKQEIAIRLTAADAMSGAYTTVLASTEVGSGADALALSAERAAYKLLYRLTRPSTPVAEIEGRAALRQGLALLAPYARGEDATTDAGKVALEKAVSNLDFAAQSLRGDGSAPPWPEVLRYRALACFMANNLPRAMHSLQEVLDTRCADSKRSAVVDRLAREAKHNLAVVLMRMGGVANLIAAQSLFTASLLEAAPDGGLDGTSVSAQLGRVQALSALDSTDWQRVDVTRAGVWLRESWAALRYIKPGEHATPADERRIEFVRTEFIRAFGMAWSRFLFAQSPGSRIAKPSQGPDTTITVQAHECFGAWIRTHVGDFRELVAFSHLALVDLAYAEAHSYAVRAITRDPKNEFAYYLAAEALFQAKDMPGAIAASARWQADVTEPAFQALRAALAEAAVAANPAA